MVTRRLVRSSARVLAGLEWPVFDASGPRDGPRVCLLAGVDPPLEGQQLVERYVWLRSSTAGWWRPAVDVGESIAAGDPLGTVLDGFGAVIDTITAPEAGVPLFITSSPAVQAGGLSRSSGRPAR